MNETQDVTLPAWKALPLLTVAWSMPGLLQCLQEVSYAKITTPDGPDYPKIFFQFLPTWYPWILFTPLIVALVRRYPVKGPAWRHLLLIHLPACIAVVFAHILIVGLVRVNFPPGPSPMPSLTQWMINTWWSLMTQAGVMAYCGVVVVAQSWDDVRALRERDVRAARLEGQLASARIQALQTQLQPHFLFNTLNSVVVLMRQDVDQAERMLLRLGDLLRIALDQDGATEVTLARDLECTRAYVDIEQVRFSDRLRVQYDVSERAARALVPSMLLQPLVENAIRHGIAKCEAGGTIRIEATTSGRELEIVVRDDGPGIRVDHTEGIGLFNTRERLRERYGPNHEFEIKSPDSGGTLVRIRLPYDEAIHA